MYMQGFHETMHQPQFWLSLIISTAIIIIPIYLWKVIYFLILHPEFNEEGVEPVEDKYIEKKKQKSSRSINRIESSEADDI
jgi:hypothetical protein